MSKASQVPLPASLGEPDRPHTPPPAHTLVHVFTVAGSLDFLRGQVGFLGGQGFAVHVVASPEGDALGQFAAAEGALAHEILMTRAMTPLSDIRSLFRIWRLLGRLSPDIVHAGTPKGGFLGIVAAFAHQVPVRIYHMHGIKALTARGWRRIVLMTTEWLTCRLATRVLCVGESTRATAVAAGLCSADRVVVLGAGSCNGVDARTRFDPDRIGDDERHALRRALDIPLGCPVVGFVGRVVRDKGIVELAAAWETLAAEIPDLHLLMVGPVEGGDPVPEAILNRLRHHRRVRFVSGVKDPVPYYALMDVVTLPSHREGLPNVPLEAAAMRLPVVATAVTGCIDAVVDGETGTLVPPGSTQGLAAAIRAYLASPDLRRRHGENGRERVMRDFVPQAMWQRVRDLYSSELDRISVSSLAHQPGAGPMRD
ncbi:MAG: glycosyltransferase family 4 protein [Verrucomicrobiota bacterium]